MTATARFFHGLVNSLTEENGGIAMSRSAFCNLRDVTIPLFPMWSDIAAEIFNSTAKRYLGDDSGFAIGPATADILHRKINKRNEELW